MLTINPALYAGSVDHVIIISCESNPYPLCGLYSISAQNGYDIVLLTLVASRGVTDLYPS